ncbi:arsenic resistance N-acetyltransferase ArsN2 [Flavisolibacter nicotianae]|uniref:arsenic resistance N-acetyltransferase ArsN2 n=1 Tax=Flavisolibacter nicotianae TaxID=2364882 RepID=UPI000EB451BF|nr:arsenic resistance N-acetyltransferase ArsN2 [Flavisolibacter nicotianae]
MTVSPVSTTTYENAIDLLARANLPVQDIGEHTELFELKTDAEIIGTIGLEHNGTVGLLRSLSVEEGSRGKGYGEQLVGFLEETAKARGIETLYLLTTTAAAFFSKRGYLVIGREEVPPFVKQTTEFSSVCPSTATLMRKQLV